MKKKKEAPIAVVETPQDPYNAEDGSVDVKDLINDLYTFNESVNKAIESLATNGLWVDFETDEDLPVIRQCGHSEFGAFSTGMAISLTDGEYTASPVLFANTTNVGPVYAAPSEDGKTTYALLPVITPCVLGTPASPYGVYVPITDESSIRDGINVLEHLIPISETEEDPDSKMLIIKENSDISWFK